MGGINLVLGPKKAPHSVRVERVEAFASVVQPLGSNDLGQWREPAAVKGNALLAALTTAELDALGGQSQISWLEEGEVLPSSQHDLIYFPMESIVSGLSVLGDGHSVEAITVGSEGTVGLSQSVYGHRSVLRWEVLIPGRAWRMPGRLFRAHLGQRSRFADACRDYSGVLAHDVVTTLSCNALHSLSGRYARWLLLLSDRLGWELPVTQERAAMQLGVSRQSISSVAADFHRDGLIDQARGRIGLLDRRGVEDQSCICYWELGGRPGAKREPTPTRR